jgi:hypothetical protein
MLASFPANMVNHDSHPLENPYNRFCLFGTRSRGFFVVWLRGQDLNLRPSGYEPDELPGCSTPRQAENGGRTPEGGWALIEVCAQCSALCVMRGPRSKRTRIVGEEEARTGRRRSVAGPLSSLFPFFAGLATTYSPMS